VILFLGLYFFGQTVPPHEKKAAPAGGQSNASAGKSLDFQDILQAAKARLNPVQLSHINRLENSVVRGDVKNQQIHAYRELAVYWKDSVGEAFLPFAYYTGEAAKLENSEKSLTFAAQLFLESLRGQDNPVLKTWMATSAKELFEKALELDPHNDSAKIGLGASYIFGSSAGNPQEVMQGIQQLLEVTRRDSTNMYAQFMLGLGGIESGQFDKAIDRLTNVVRHEPSNFEAVILLAGAFEQKGDKANAVKWYQEGRKLIRNPDMIREIDQRIQSMQ
jgi:Tfp pilus assembly protein PilF